MSTIQRRFGALMRYIAVILASVFLATVAAVGVSAVDSPVAKAAGGGSVKKCGGGKIKLNAKEKETFLRHNKIRNSRNLKPFCVHPKLQKIARSHSKDMVRRNYFNHNTKGSGRTPAQRAKSAGYRYRAFGENIGSGYNPDAMVKAWMKSSSHRSNILSKKYREIGVGVAGENNRTKYTVDFGTRL